MDVDAFIDSANREMISSSEANSTLESAWDGLSSSWNLEWSKSFGGLVLIGESAAFREEGMFTAYAPLMPSSSTESQRMRATFVSVSHQSTPFFETTTGAKANKASETLSPPPEKRGSEEETTGRSVLQKRLSTNSKKSAHTSNRSESDKSRKEEQNRLTALRHPHAANGSSPESAELLMNSATKILGNTVSDADRFKSRLVAVLSEGLSNKETMLKCAGIADDAFRLAVKKLKSGEFADVYLLAEVAESACPAFTSTARDKIVKLKQSAWKRMRKCTVE